MRPETLAARRRLYLLARVVVARHYRRELTLAMVASRWRARRGSCSARMRSSAR